MLIHGMGGLGKSSLAARLCDRLGPDYNVVIRVGRIDEHGLANRLGEDLDKPIRDLLMNPDDELKFKLRDLFGRLDTPLLLVLDDFEVNFETRKDGLELRDGLPVISTAAKTVLNALVFAIRKNPGSLHRVIITTRYLFAAEEVRFFRIDPLYRMPDADVKKKVTRLEAESTIFTSPSESIANLKSGAVSVADGNPRLLEWLFAILAEEDLDIQTILDRMAAEETKFREDILARELLKQQTSAFRRMLGRMLIYELPVPMAAARSILEGIHEVDIHMNRASALELLETTRQPEKTLHRAPRILEPLLKTEQGENTGELYGASARALHEIWWEKAKMQTEERGLEIHRLALAGNETEIAVEITDRLTTSWHNQGRFREAVSLCENTLSAAGDDYRLLHGLARSEAILGNTENALVHYKTSLENCSESDEKERASVMHNMAGIYANQGQIKKALSLNQQTLEIQESIGDVKGKATTMAMIAQHLAREGDYKTALGYLNESLEILEHLESPDAETVREIMADVQVMEMEA